MNRHLFFLPGVGADPDFWRPLGDRLPADWRKTYFGWPGLGDQPVDPGINSYDDLIGLVEAQLPEYPVDVLAQSMGGAIALSLALRRPDRIRKLVLAVTSGGMDMTAFGATDWRLDYRHEFPEAAEWIMAGKPDISNRLSEINQPALLIWGMPIRSVPWPWENILPNAYLMPHCMSSQAASMTLSAAVRRNSPA